MNYLRAVGKFCYDFVIGDDWKIAVSVVLALIVTYGLRLAKLIHGQIVPIVGALLVMVAFSLSLYIDTRKQRQLKRPAKTIK